MDWAFRLLSSSIGKKVQVALAGLLLCGFLLSHLAGNLLLWAGPAAFNEYAEMLEHNALLPVAEVGLALLFAVHIATALWVRRQNALARPVAYESSTWAGGRTPGSATMLWTGLFMMIFLVVHVWTMRLEDHGGDLYRHVLHEFESVPYAVFYLVAMVALGFHLSHGFQAAFRTLGLEHPKYTPVIVKGGLAFSAAISLGFGALAVWAGFLAGGAP